jgi:hypothetical protein
MKEALFPTSEEIIASVILVTLDVGWVDMAKAFTFDGCWYTTFARDPHRPTSSEYVALTPRIRSKTSREIWSKAAHTETGGSWWALRRIQNRTHRLRALCKSQVGILSDQSASDPENDFTRLEFERWQDLACLAFIYYGLRGPNSAIGLSGSAWSDFLRNIPKLADFDIRQEHEPLFDTITHYDLRHIVAHRTLKESGFFATQQLLGHAYGTTTMGYLASHQLKEELFAAYARVTGIAFEEIEGKAVLNRAIIQKRFILNGAELTVQERQELGAVTLQGARCKDPTSPPPEAGSQTTTRCIDGSCIRCPLAVWNWHDDLAIQLAVDEFARLDNETSPSTGIVEETDMAAWVALFNEIPNDLQPRLKTELKRVKMALRRRRK